MKTTRNNILYYASTALIIETASHWVLPSWSPSSAAFWLLGLTAETM